MQRNAALHSTALGAWHRVGYLDVECILAVCRVFWVVCRVRDAANVKHLDVWQINAYLRAHALPC